MKRLLLLLIPLVLVVGCSDSSDLEARLEAENASLKEVTQTNTPATTSTTPVATQAAVKQNVWTIAVGDCLNTTLTKDDTDGIEVSHVESVSCDDPHSSEIYATFELPDSSWKDEDYVFEQAGIGCEARFEAFVGIEMALSKWYKDSYYPTEESWNEMGDREVACAVTDESGMKTSGSAKGSRR